jgi:hypothetical protein
MRERKEKVKRFNDKIFLEKYASIRVAIGCPEAIQLRPFPKLEQVQWKFIDKSGIIANLLRNSINSHICE